MQLLEATLQAQIASHDWHSVTSAVAVSGGADSVALLRGLANMQAMATGSLVVLHFNHGLRGADSDADTAFVAALAKELGLRCVMGRAAPAQLSQQGDSLEAAARDARYRFFQEAANEIGARYLFTAHTADDQAETILHRILRGTGVDGLAGIPRFRGLSPLTTILRPLLGVRRREIVAYLAALSQGFRDDATNADQRFTRNRLRHDLLPKLAAEYNPQVVEALVRLGEMAGEAQGCVDGMVERLADRCVTRTGEEISVETGALRGQSAFLVRQLFIRIWQQQRWPLQAMTYEKWQQLAALARTRADTALNLPGDVRAKKQGEQLVLSRPADRSS